MQLVCPHCGTRNRVPDDKLRHEIACGRCHADVMPAAPVALGDADLPAYLAGTELPVVVDFWAAWCGPCKMMAPQFSLAASQMPLVRFIKVDTDAAPMLSSSYGIRSIPTLMLFQQGRELARLSGAVSAAELQRWIRAHLPAGAPA